MDGPAEATHSAGRGAAVQVRLLAHLGLLAERARTTSGSGYLWLRRGAYEITWPVVFDGLSRVVERRRGHRLCAAGIEHLEPNCLDRFEDDVEALVDDLLRHATVPIRNLEGWIRSRLIRATVDANRRRRGERGALQRPRIPLWLERLVGADPWRRALTLDILTWVDIPAAAGAGLWPYAAWADRRAALTGEIGATEKDVERDVEDVLAMMRCNEPWYRRYIERPLGRKQAPLAPADDTGDSSRDRPHLALCEQNEADDALLREMATAAIDRMAERCARGEDRRSVVLDVVATLFGGGLRHLDRAPGTESSDDEHVRALLADPEASDRLVRQVCEILGIRDS